MRLNWRNHRPKKYYARCVEMFGTPDAASGEPNGFAIWKTRGLFDEHVLRDEDVKHCVPRPHHDYFYSSVLFYVPDSKLCDVLKISGSLNYDGLKKLLTARCGGIGANYATLYLAMAVASGKLSIEEVKKDEMYPRMIQEKILSYDEIKKRMRQMKRKNNKEYGKELAAEYATFAYKQCYNKSRKRGGKRILQTRKRCALRNTRGECCSKGSWSSCCPHMQPDAKGRYAATNEETVLKLGSRKYRIKTCCRPCATAMQTAWDTDRTIFNRSYKPQENEKGDLWLHNKHTGRRVQLAKRIK